MHRIGAGGHSRPLEGRAEQVGACLPDLVGHGHAQTEETKMMLLALAAYILFFTGSAVLAVWFYKKRLFAVSAAAALVTVAYGVGLFFL
jgi:hypothetical protein